MRCDRHTFVLIAKITLVLSILILAACEIGISFAKLEANEVGLDYSETTMTVDGETLYTNGVHFIGAYHRFIIYPKTTQQLLMESDSITARTADGLTVLLQVKILYRLNTDLKSLHNLFLTFGEFGHTEAYYHVSRSVIRDVACNYTAFQFWSQREIISFDMQTQLEPVMKDIYANLDTFTLISFDLPEGFQNALVQTDVMREEYEAVQFERESASITAQTNLIRAEQQVYTIGNIANANVESIRLQADANLFSMNYTIVAELEGYKEVSKALNLTQTQLLQFVWLDSVTFWARDSSKVFSIQTSPLMHVG